MNEFETNIEVVKQAIMLMAERIKYLEERNRWLEEQYKNRQSN